MDYYADVIWIVEGCCSAFERGIIEPPLRGSDLPNELGKIVPVFPIAGPAAFGGKIILVPPLELILWRQRHPPGFPDCRSDTRSPTPLPCSARAKARR